MQAFNFKCPTEIVFGPKAQEHIAEKIKAYGKSRVFIVYGGGSVIESGLLPRIESQLTAAGLSLQVRGGVKPNPRLAWVRGAINDAMIFKADFILAVGGGSVIDSAKAVAHGAANPGVDIWDFWSGKVKLEKTTAMGAVLTLAAAGSETSDSAVLTNEETGKKAGLNTDLNRPTLAFMNPELAFTAPKRQVFCGIADILMHTMERYFTRDTAPNEMTDIIAEGLMKNVIKHSRTLLDDPKNYDAMSEIMWCGSLSHNNLTELSGRFDVTHGASLTTVWGSWAGYVWQDNPERFARFAENIWGITAGTTEEKAQKGIEATLAYFKEIDMPVNFTELGIGVQNKEMIEYLADMVTSDGTKTVATFHPIDKETAMEIYQLANH